MRTAEHNTGLAELQQELDKFNEDRQGNKEGRKKEAEAGDGCRSNERGESGRTAQRLTDGFQVSHKPEQDQSLALIYMVIKLLGAF